MTINPDAPVSFNIRYYNIEETRTTLHGFFSEEPYPEVAFSFEGAGTALITPPPVVGPQAPSINLLYSSKQAATHCVTKT